MRARRSRAGRIGLALAGGGPAGAVYEIGALRALEEALDGVDFNDLAVYVGVSAGSAIAASLANGLTPTQMVRAIVMREPGEGPLVPETFFTPAYREWLQRGIQVPRLLGEALWGFLRRPTDQTLTQSLTRLARALPVALFDSEPTRSYFETLFTAAGRSDDFRELQRKLIVVAADLEAAQPILFGLPPWDRVPISTAVQASTALPGLYAPVRIAGRLCVDGVLLRTVHASAALKDGVDLLFCINPIVPIDTAAGGAADSTRRGLLLEHGLPSVLSQTFRTLVHSRMEVGLKTYQSRFPDADVVLFEPERTERRMFFSNIFSFASRRAVCQLAYEATRRDLLARRRHLEPLLARHGIRVNVDALSDSTRDVWAGMATERQVPLAQAVGALERALRRGA